MSSGGEGSSHPPSPKKSRLSPLPSTSTWVPSCTEHDSNSQGGQESCVSADSGLSDSATPPHDSGAPPIPSSSSMAELPEAEDEDKDDLSSLSGLSDMSGQEWKPNMSGKLAWLHRAMARGEDPRKILVGMLPPGSDIPEGIDAMTLWKILFNLLSEPPKRSKLPNINTIEDCVELIKSCSNILILTGAGVSVSCGIPDFRSKDGVYARLAQDFPDLPDPQAMFDIHYFRKDPRPFFKFAREIYPGQFKPSPCHRFIKAVEASGKLLRNYTQNIDTLEQVAGIEGVVQCHGSFATASCMMCKAKVDANVIREDIFEQKIPLCNTCPKQDIEAILKKKDGVVGLGSSNETSSKSPEKTGHEENFEKNDEADSSSKKSLSHVVNTNETIDSLPPESPFAHVSVMKPDIVFFGEGLPDHFHNSITRDKEHCDLLIVIGSSLKVRPVALIPSSLPPEVPQILINREPLPHLNFDVELLGDCDAIINQVCLMLGEAWGLPVHSDLLQQHMGLPSEYYKAKEATASCKSPDVGEDSLNTNSASEDKDSFLNSGEPSKSSETEKEESKNKIDKENEDDSDEEFDPYSKSLAEFIPKGKFLFLPPSRYIFTGAEVYPDSSDDELDNEDEDEEDNDETHPEEFMRNDQTEETENHVQSSLVNEEHQPS